MTIPSTSIVRATWLALLAPKRLVPILVVCVPLVLTQAAFSREPLATPLGIVMCLAFVALAPVSYRVLFPDGLDLSHGAVRVVLYSLVGAGIVLSLGVGVPKLLHMRPTFLTDRSSLAVIIAMFLVGGWGLGRDVGFEQRLTRLQAEAERAQLLSLRAHLDPHFLFNTLNAIAEWCRIDGAVAEQAVLKLSQMLRTVLSGVKEPLWPLEKELELVRMLFDLHLLRDKELFQLELTAPSPLPDVKVPPMSLLTLAENAVKHGPAKGHRGRVVVCVVASPGALTVAVENPGPFGGPRDGSDGLPTLVRQLQLATNGRAKLSIGPAGEGRTRAELVLPETAA
ncbi:MAG: histidine kinase [Myxococcaceae bacterium]|nr:histidine kinase [Myxococcaceae bacterium]